MESDLQLTGNSVLISWALENIIKNAIDAIDHDSGLIEISSSMENKSVLILITDNGKGISKRDRKNIFRPGFSSKNKGWGMGLSLVKRIIEDIHGGKIRVMDSTNGKGATFQISLPR